MFSLLKIKATGFKMLADNFTIDFLTQARVNLNEDNNSEIIEVDKNLYIFNLIALTGSNSSGKTTTLELIRKVLKLMKTGRWSYNKLDFNSNKINIYIEFYLDKEIYLYNADIIPINNIMEGEINSQFCKIENESLKKAKYDGICGRNYIKKLNFTEDDKVTGIDDTSKLIFICKEKSNIYYVPEFSKNGVLVSNIFFESLNFFGKELTSEIIKLLDDSIEYINFDGTDSIKFKRHNQEEILVTKFELLKLLSNGTIKGIDLYIRITMLLKTGGIMIIDEIENCFHKNLVNNLLFLITDKKLNINKGQIIFTTHYVEILDIFERRDNIFILHKNNNVINIENLYLNYDIRTEILKSKQFNNNTFNTLLDYDQLMKVKRLLKHEIFNND